MQSSATTPAPRLLFVPVSGAYGMGEYARSLAIARGARRRWPDAVMHFVLSRQAPYAAATPFPTTLLDSSATFHSVAVVELLASFRPDVAIFDNAGRTAQLAAARQVGARVVYISSRARQRRKAFRRRWMALIDEHWIAYPEFIAGGLRWFERLKLRLLHRPRVRYLDVIHSPADPELRAAILARCGCDSGSFVLIVPGGGTGHPGAGDAVGQFREAALALAARGVHVVFVGPMLPAACVAHGAVAHDAVQIGVPHWHPQGSLPQAELVELMRAAHLIVANGGSTLLQAVACGAACVTVPIAKDQAERARRCVAAGVAVTARLDAVSIEQAALALLQNDVQRAELARRAAQLGLTDGVELAVEALAGLIWRGSSGGAP